ncbi:unnamed protein product [Arctogadus glacialis]
MRMQRRVQGRMQLEERRHRALQVGMPRSRQLPDHLVEHCSTAVASCSPGGTLFHCSSFLFTCCDRKHAPAPGAHAEASRGHTGSSKGHGRHHATRSESSERGNLLGVLRSCGLLVSMNHGQDGGRFCVVLWMWSSSIKRWWGCSALVTR